MDYNKDNIATAAPAPSRAHGDDDRGARRRGPGRFAADRVRHLCLRASERRASALRLPLAPGPGG